MEAEGQKKKNRFKNAGTVLTGFAKRIGLIAAKDDEDGDAIYKGFKRMVIHNQFVFQFHLLQYYLSPTHLIHQPYYEILIHQLIRCWRSRLEI